MPSLYNLIEWKRLRRAQLAAQPWCAFCIEPGVRTPATVVDHITPHRGDKELFFDPLNLQSLCKCCHDSIKQRFEKSGVLKGGDASGMPLDQNHHWNLEGVKS